jgi:flagellar hook-basal body complex protein FliE
MDSISLIAQTAYAKVNSQPVVDNVKEASNFHDMVNVSFNRFASMSPDQVLSYINNVKATGIDATNTISQNTMAGSMIDELRKKLSKNDQVLRKSLINEASLLDVVNTTNEAKNTLQLMVSLRDKMLEAYEKLMSTQI